MKRFVVVCVLVLAASAVGQTAGNHPATPASSPKTVDAATADSPVKVDPAKAADILRLMELIGTKALVNQVMQTTENSLRPLMTNALPPGEYREKLVELFFEKFHSKSNVQQLLDLAVPVYDKYYTHQEIRGLIEFYSTPLGQKTTSVLPSLMGELQQAGRKWGEDLGRDSMQEVLKEHPDLRVALEEAGERQRSK